MSLIFIRETERRNPTPKSKKMENFALFLCECGSVVEIYKRHGISGRTKTCKTCADKIRKQKSTKHGCSRSRYYRIWSDIKDRCFNKNNKYYKDYGERGIDMYKEWVNNPVLFIEYILKLENSNTETYSIDRIDNDKGYYPDNLRFACKVTQSNNQRFQKPKNKYYGVRKRKNIYIAEISDNGKYIYLGSSSSELECAIIREKYIIENNLKNIKNNIEVNI